MERGQRPSSRVVRPGLSTGRCDTAVLDVRYLSGVALLLIDLQTAFFEVSPLAEQRDRLVDRCNELVAWADSAGVPIILVRTEHRADRSTWTLSMLDDDQGFLLEGDQDARVLPHLNRAGALEVVKTRDSAFHRTGLAELLAGAGRQAVVIAGVSTHTCVAATAADAYAHNVRVTLACDAIASHRPELHELTLSTLNAEFRFPVVGHADLLRARAT